MFFNYKIIHAPWLALSTRCHLLVQRIQSSKEHHLISTLIIPYTHHQRTVWNCKTVATRRIRWPLDSHSSHFYSQRVYEISTSHKIVWNSRNTKRSSYINKLGRADFKFHIAHLFFTWRNQLDVLTLFRIHSIFRRFSGSVLRSSEGTVILLASPLLSAMNHL